jgi:7-carboxy-7-deazaguanine synthase
MRVCEIFTSIQGESSYAGIPCTFIRLTGCNLRCTYCDTTYAYDEGKEMGEEEILTEVERAGFNLVEITGGEPLLQTEVYQLISNIIDRGHNVLIETNGSMSIRDIDRRATVILDVKTPGSGMSEKMDFSNFEILKNNDEIKFVITDMKDYEWVKDVILSNHLQEKCHLLMSPAYGILSPENLAGWMIRDKLEARLNLQIHKYIFGTEKRGV